jgi:hypothetical protein
MNQRVDERPLTGVCEALRRRPYDPRPTPPSRPRTFRQAEQVVKLFSVGDSLDVLVPVPAYRDDDVDRTPCAADVEGLRSTFDPCTRFPLRNAPCATCALAT